MSSPKRTNNNPQNTPKAAPNEQLKSAGTRTNPRLFLLLLAAALLAALYFLWRELALTGGRFGVPLDDAYIHYQFARNLSQGHGFSFNPGLPTPGSTAPLWTLLLGVVGLFTQEFLGPSLLLSFAFFLLTLWLTYRLALDLTGQHWAAALAGLGVALAGRLLWAGLAGMETTAFAAASLAAVWQYRRRGLDGWAALLFGLAAQLRPEGHALFALALAGSGWHWWHSPKPRPGLPRTLLLPLAIYALTALPYSLFSLSTTGRPLPNTFYAKADTTQLYSLRTLRETLALHWQDNYAALLLLPFGLWPAWRRGRLLLLWPLALWLLVPAIVAQVWHHGRYTMPLIPFQMLLAAAGAAWLVETLPGRVHLPRLQLPRWLPAGLLLLILLSGLARLPYWAGMLGYNTQEILAIDVAMGRWLAANTRPGALIAADDIGAIGFLSERPILDLQGLVSPELWPVLQEPLGQPRSEAYTRALSQIQPDYLAIFPTWHYEMAANPWLLTPIQRFWVASHTIIFDQEAKIYTPTWPYVSAATPQTVTNATFGAAIDLLGYDLANEGDSLRLTLYWRSAQPAGRSYDVFIHLLDEAGEIVAQVDEKPLAGLAPTTRWQPGDLLRDPHRLPWPADLPPGTYRLAAGLFDRETMARLPLTTPAGAGDTLILGQITRAP